MSISEITYNPFEPGYIDNPYPALRRLREADPVHHSPFGFWLLTRYDDVNAVMRDVTNMSVDDRKAPRRLLEDIDRDLSDVILTRDPPDHTRWRALMSKAFTPTTVETSRPHIQELTDEVLDKAAADGGFDFIADLAYPLPFRLIADLLGMPVADRPRILEWTTDIVKIVEPVWDVAVMKAIADATDHMSAYLSALISERRAHPADDVLSAMISAEHEGDVLTETELVEHVILLFTAAHEPTTNFLGNAMLALLRHPDQMALLREDPSLDVNATEELLRFDSPFQFAMRFVIADVEIDGHLIEAGNVIAMSVASANHDPARWGPTADDLDLRRPRASEHLAFSRGPHTCFGAALARAQGQAIFGSLLRRFPDVTLAGEPVWNGRLNARGLDSLPLRVG